MQRLSNASRKNARTAANAAALVLGDAELVECVVQGQLYGSNAVIALTTKRVLIVNEREFKPDVVEVPVDSAVTVQGWADDRVAALLIQREPITVQVDRITDKAIAQEFAQRLRGRAGG